ncbi:hypothetical protein U9M48_042110 [Paspalum notatum var. saurae]|uniref:Fungal lipase-type domain-containing protein n=1 Tax=Paspalum notatum var. saurae TaxID=547442 RepID=A0AAQ3XFK6_PASNO
MGEMGHVHVGFLKALGLQEDDGADAVRAFPAAAVGDKPLAYYALREAVCAQLTAHPNAKVVVRGHSLGGALAAIFPALLAFHDERDILDRLLTVVTYGQPRVGNQAFTDFVRAGVPVEPLQVVDRYDVVPRVPFDAPPIAEFVHGGTCVYFDGWYDGRAIAAGGDVPNPNYFDTRYLLSMYGNAWGDLSSSRAPSCGPRRARTTGRAPCHCSTAPPGCSCPASPRIAHGTTSTLSASAASPSRPRMSSDEMMSCIYQMPSYDLQFVQVKNSKFVMGCESV